MQAKFKLFLAVRERFTRETKPYYKFAKFVPKIGNFFFFYPRKFHPATVFADRVLFLWILFFQNNFFVYFLKLFFKETLNQENFFFEFTSADRTNFV